MKKKKKDPPKIVETLINKMFEISGHTIRYQDILNTKEEWYNKYTMTTEQNKEWREWGIKYVKKELKIYKNIAEREMNFFNLMYGLKIEDKKEEQ